jgi:ankyrin repeat protein
MKEITHFGFSPFRVVRRMPNVSRHMRKPKFDPRFQIFRDAACSDLQVAAGLLAEDPKMVLLRNGIGETAMHFLAVEDHREAVSWLIENGAEVDTRNEFGQTPLMEVASLGMLDMCQLLVSRGASFRYVSSRGDSVFSAVTESDQVEVLGYLLELLPLEEDINLFFDNVAAEMALKHSPHCAALLTSRGLTKRWG